MLLADAVPLWPSLGIHADHSTPRILCVWQSDCQSASANRICHLLPGQRCHAQHCQGFAKVLVVGKVEGDAASDHGFHKVHFELILLVMGHAKSLNFEPCWPRRRAGRTTTLLGSLTSSRSCSCQHASVTSRLHKLDQRVNT